MAAAPVATERPETPDEAAELLRALGAEGRSLRVRGGGTKRAWGAEGEPVAVELETGGLTRVVEHNEGDFTAVVEAGMPFAEAAATFAQTGQMFALDPPLGAGDAATVGGVVATADSGPLRHRYGAVRDLIVGITVALSDGSLANAGGRVIKNVAGYDLGKLFSGSFGTLGLVVSVAVRLHPRPEETATASGASDDPAVLAAAAAALARLPLEADSLDVAWRDGAGRLLVRFGGTAAERQAAAVADRLRAAGLQEVDATGDDGGLWAAQRDGQRSADGAVLKVSGRASDLHRVLDTATEAGADVVGRAALGLSWLTLEGDDLPARVAAVRAALAPRACTLLDAPEAVRAACAPWPDPDPGALAVMRRVKERFDPARIFRPGAFVGGI
ncbi:MAG: glycolate oxidase binding subunit [Solirubrobacteraceae bacterium]|jgi:glycolate oxidase FAD binding subunit|nr:glycolate oxidase binding subunit [Solirubrobacteraceae bacterium]